jgi:hypothetical protein
MVVHAYDPSSSEAKAGGSQVGDQLEWCSKTLSQIKLKQKWAGESIHVTNKADFK